MSEESAVKKYDMTRDECFRWCALQMAPQTTGEASVLFKVVTDPPDLVKRAQYLEAYLRGDELPEWIAVDNSEPTEP